MIMVYIFGYLLVGSICASIFDHAIEELGPGEIMMCITIWPLVALGLIGIGLYKMVDIGISWAFSLFEQEDE